jgi:hypothetical protein
VTDRSIGALTSQREIVAVLRLVVSGGGAVLYGEAIDAETELPRRFRDWIGMRAAIRELVTDALASGGDDSAPPPGASAPTPAPTAPPPGATAPTPAPTAADRRDP